MQKNAPRPKRRSKVCVRLFKKVKTQGSGRGAAGAHARASAWGPVGGLQSTLLLLAARVQTAHSFYERALPTSVQRRRQFVSKLSFLYTHTQADQVFRVPIKVIHSFIFTLPYENITESRPALCARCGYSRLGDRKRQIEFKFARRPAATQSVPATRSQIAFPPRPNLLMPTQTQFTRSSSRPVRAAIAACHRVHFHIVKPDSRQGQILL